MGPENCLRLCFCLLMLNCFVPAEAGQAASTAKTGRITATFYGLQSRDGYLRVSLYTTAANFPDGVPAARKDIRLTTLNTKSRLDAVTVSFTGLRSGSYAVCAFHDRDGSGRLKQNFLGIPTEEWGMSNNPRPKLRAPRFDEAQLDFTAPATRTISINLSD